MDACSQLPCPTGTTCTDLTPAEEESLGVGYKCSQCPQGFVLNGSKCTGRAYITVVGAIRLITDKV